MTAFEQGDTVEANTNEQGLAKGARYQVVGVEKLAKGAFGTFMTYTVESTAGVKLQIANGHLLLSKVATEPELDCADTAMVEQQAKALLNAASGDAQRAAEDARMLAAEATKEGNDDAAAFWLNVATAVGFRAEERHGTAPEFGGMHSLAIKLLDDAQIQAARDGAQATTEALNIGIRMAGANGISEKPIRVLKDDATGESFLLVEVAVVKGLAWHLEQMADPSNELCVTDEDVTAARQLAEALRAVA